MGRKQPTDEDLRRSAELALREHRISSHHAEGFALLAKALLPQRGEI